MAVPTAHPVPEYPKVIEGRTVRSKEEEFHWRQRLQEKELAKPVPAEDHKALIDAHENLRDAHRVLEEEIAKKETENKFL